MSRPLCFAIQLMNCNGQILAQWNYDEMWPVGAPTFSYPNGVAAAPYVLRFASTGHMDAMLPAHVDLNAAIHVAVAAHVEDIRDNARLHV